MTELSDSRDDLKQRALGIYKENNNQAGEPSRLNVSFGSRLIYSERPWVNEVFKKHLSEFINLDRSASDIIDLINSTLQISSLEWIDLKEQKIPASIWVHYDFINWKNNKYMAPIHEQRIEPRLLIFGIEDVIKSKVMDFNRDFAGSPDSDYYYHALEFIRPRHKLLYDLSYSDAHSKLTATEVQYT